MTWTQEELRSRLSEKRVLIIEDDPDLAPRLKQLLSECGVDTVIVKRCVEGEQQGGLHELCIRGTEYDIVCVDVMLPPDEATLMQADRLLNQWNDLQTEGLELRERGSTPAELGDLRERLNEVSRLLRACVDREAGVKMIRKWLESCGESRKETRILFLTARQESVGEDIPELVEHAKWLTKPATGQQVLTAVAELLND